MKGNNIKKNKKDILKIAFIICGIIGITFIVCGILILWSEGFSNLLIKLISLLKQRSPYLLVDGKPVYTLWLVKLNTLGILYYLSLVLTVSLPPSIKY